MSWGECNLLWKSDRSCHSINWSTDLTKGVKKRPGHHYAHAIGVHGVACQLGHGVVGRVFWKEPRWNDPQGFGRPLDCREALGQEQLDSR